MKWGFFDVDSREAGAGNVLDFRPRVRPIGDKLNQLYHFAAREDAVLLFTTCCSGCMPEKTEQTDVLFVPMRDEDDGWRGEVGDYKKFYLEKRKTSPDLSCLETFSYNRNASELLAMLDVDEWVVFGNGLDLCVNHVMERVLQTGLPVTFLEDVMIGSAKGYGPSGTDENRLAVFAKWRQAGAVQQNLEEFLARCAD